MNSQISIFLGLVVLCSLFYDAAWHDWQGTLFLAKKGMELIEWLAFWR